MFKQIFISVFLIQITVYGFTQAQLLNLDRDRHWIYETELNNKEHNAHTAIKPYLHSDINQYVAADSLYTERAFWDYFKKNKNYIGDSLYRARSRIGGDLLFGVEPGWEFSSNLVTGDTGLIKTNIGLSIDGQIGKRFAFDFNYYDSNSSYRTFVNSYIDSMNVIPGQGYAKGTTLGHHHHQFSGYLSYSPVDEVNFQLGHGKNHWGDGYRSLLLSDVANNYTYFKITTKIWNIKYVNLYTALRDVRQWNDKFLDYGQKFAAFHYLSWNAFKWLNIGLFEAVLWQGQDSLNDRGFDFTYLNPVIFFRPVEAANGSADNSLVGASIKIRAHKNLQLYAQLLLDEFKLDQILAGNGWSGNKQGVQAGFKWFNIGLKGLHLQGEFNYARPFTYSHIIPEQNYAHFNQPLAHPLGSNFREVIGIVRYQRSRLSIESKFIYANFGVDSAGTNYGSDIYKSYITASRSMGNYTSQGIKTELFSYEIRGSYLIYPKANLKVELGMAYRNRSSSIENGESTFIWFGIKTALQNLYRDFL